MAAVGITIMAFSLSGSYSYTADSPDGRFRVYAGILTRGFTPAALDFLEVRISKRMSFIGMGPFLISHRIFACSKSTGVGLRWNGSRNLEITSGCIKGQLEAPIQLDRFGEVTISYNHKDAWANETNRGAELLHP